MEGEDDVAVVVHGPHGVGPDVIEAGEVVLGLGPLLQFFLHVA